MGRLVAGAFVVIVLGIDTATQQTSVAIGTERGTRAQMALSATARSHEEVVIPAIQQLLQWSDLSLSQLGGVAVGIGPGLFTGLRVGVETARTLAQFLRIPTGRHRWRRAESRSRRSTSWCSRCGTPGGAWGP